LSHYDYKPGVPGLIPDEVTEFIAMYLNLTVALGSGVYSASHRNEYQKQRKNISGESIAAGV
jgi:hypothetical protein